MSEPVDEKDAKRFVDAMPELRLQGAGFMTCGLCKSDYGVIIQPRDDVDVIVAVGCRRCAGGIQVIAGELVRRGGSA